MIINFQQNNMYLNISVDQLCCFSANEIFTSISENDESALLLIIIDRQFYAVAVSKASN